MMANFKREIQALRASKVAKDCELQACKVEDETCKAKVEAYKARVEILEAKFKGCMAGVANGEVVQVSTAPKGNALRPPAFHKARSTMEIDNFL